MSISKPPNLSVLLVTTSLAPASPSAFAIAKPMPLVPPVTIATLSVTLNLSKSFKTGFTLGFYATKTDISAFEFGEGSFDKGIYFSIPLDVVSSKYRKNNARFVWKNLTRDGGAILSGGLDLNGYVENSSSYFLNYLKDGFYE